MKKKVIFLITLFLLISFTTVQANPVAWIGLFFGIFQSLRPSEKFEEPKVICTFTMSAQGIEPQIMNIAGGELSAWINTNALSLNPKVAITADLNVALDPESPIEKMKVVVNSNEGDSDFCKEIEQPSSSGWTIILDLKKIYEKTSFDLQRSNIIRVYVKTKEDAEARSFLFLNFTGQDFLGSSRYQMEAEKNGKPYIVSAHEVLKIFSDVSCIILFDGIDGEKIGKLDCDKEVIVSGEIFSKLPEIFYLTKVIDGSFGEKIKVNKYSGEIKI